jgi:hypothetical protein
MRRYNVSEAPRSVLANDLGELIRREEHLNPDRPDRAESYRRALAEIEMGAPAAMARRTEFRVNEDCTRRYGVSDGTREELLAELDRYRSDRNKEGREEKARLIARAMADLEQLDVTEVLVERVVYRVVEVVED